MTARGVPRRHVLRAGASLVLALPLAACGKKPAPFACTDETGLSEPERGVRQALEYVDRTPFTDKPCTACVQWIEAPPRGGCGGCKVMKGPVHPDGYCKVFAKA